MDSKSKRSGAPTIVFVPTAMELRALDVDGGLARGLALTHLCGVGPIAAAARVAECLAALKPARAFLVGIAGTYAADKVPVGSALAFDVVAVDGVGAGLGTEARSLEALGFAHWTDDRGTDDHAEPRRSIGDRLSLSNPRRSSSLHRSSAVGKGPALLVTTCSASSSSTDAALRRERFPGALAEDMEGFAVALACELAGVELSIVRGISNVAGDREHRGWRIPAALSAARDLLRELLDARPQPEH